VKKKQMKKEIKRLRKRERDLLNENVVLAEELFDALQEAWTEITRLKRLTNSHWVDDIEWELNEED
jgi:hypothetical protein